jgi:hypothetical protein
MNHWAYVVAAYVLTGLSVVGYVWYLRQAERRLRGVLKETTDAQQ